MLKWLWVSALIIALDQLTKVVMSNWLDLYETVAVIPYFNFTLAHNSGAAFSFLAGAGGWQRWFFIGLAVTVSIVLIIWLSRLKSQAKLEAIAISLIIGGAIGNIIDSSFYGLVTLLIALCMVMSSILLMSILVVITGLHLISPMPPFVLARCC